MISDWLGTSWTETWLVVVSAVAIWAATVAVVRLVGARSFSKMSSFDFAVTVAVGSIIASIATSSASLPAGIVAVASLLGLQWSVAWLRRRTNFSGIVDNEPLLLVEDGNVLHENLDHARVTVDDIRAKLREANVLQMERVRAVILETTGDISVLHGEGPVDSELIADVRMADASERNRKWVSRSSKSWDDHS